jgi:SAM-dependent methyltransferase
MTNITETVREKYAEAARRVAAGGAGTCGCGTAAASVAGATGESACCDPITSNLYDEADAGNVPDLALRASLGCGNPTALARLNPGDTVLDLGSGGGIDVILSARRVGPTGKAYGLDMTDEMLAIAEENKRKAGVTNVEFLKGQIEQVPLPDNSVDVVISNCVINLSADKDRVLREAFRVLKPNGRFAVSDVVVRGEMPEDVRRSMELWVGCVAGALSEDDYRGKLTAAGFTDVDLEATRVYDNLVPGVEGQVISAFIRAKKPEPIRDVTEAKSESACCGPTCCA